ncbi:MAG TPA: hypothetical protein VM434_03135 [Beijerinckiaceae bacterium]|nr:hypothetical protein [Beijerinckiaceae bacterium]
MKAAHATARHAYLVRTARAAGEALAWPVPAEPARSRLASSVFAWIGGVGAVAAAALFTL